MITLPVLCRDLFLLANADNDVRGSRRGRQWEQQIADYLAMRNMPVEVLPGGCTVLGHTSLSMLRHQIDSAIGCADAIVIAEWKAFRDVMPKNELLRFKAATDDYFMAMGNNVPSQPVVRVFGGTGYASDELRAYAYLHGIALIERGRWPVPALVSDNVVRQCPDVVGLSAADRKHLAWTFRPVQSVLVAQHDGSFVVPRPPALARIKALDSLHEYWSDALWEEIDSQPGVFEVMVKRVQRGIMGWNDG